MKSLGVKGLNECALALSVIILASLLVFLMFGCCHSSLRQYFKFSSGMHIFKHSYMCTLASRDIFPCTFGVFLQIKSGTAGTSPFHCSLLTSTDLFIL